MCQYQISQMSSGSCQNVASYKCTHCPLAFCLKHGSEHQMNVKVEIQNLFAEAQVSHTVKPLLLNTLPK